MFGGKNLNPKCEEYKHVLDLHALKNIFVVTKAASKGLTFQKFAFDVYECTFCFAF